jgi:lipopolysaccharide/colanic/teichoic acid biosynthesis glycosyltransferase
MDTGDRRPVSAHQMHPMITTTSEFDHIELLQQRRSRWRAYAKRALDILVSATALVTFFPVFAVVALVILVDSGRPVFFGQLRVGRNCRDFVMWKFRSMRFSDGPLLTKAGDSRITRTGRFLRRTKLDELPQLWNVLRGDMGLVGPRPEVRRYVDLFASEFRHVLQVRPGMTDPASIVFCKEEELLATAADPEKDYVDVILPAKLELAQSYISVASIWFDIRVLGRTFCAIARAWMDLFQQSK